MCKCLRSYFARRHHQQSSAATRAAPRSASPAKSAASVLGRHRHPDLEAVLDQSVGCRRSSRTLRGTTKGRLFSQSGGAPTRTLGRPCSVHGRKISSPSCGWDRRSRSRGTNVPRVRPMTIAAATRLLTDGGLDFQAHHIYGTGVGFRRNAGRQSSWSLS